MGAIRSEQSEFRVPPRSAGHDVPRIFKVVGYSTSCHARYLVERQHPVLHSGHPERTTVSVGTRLGDADAGDAGRSPSNRRARRAFRR